MISDSTQELCHPDRSGAKASGVESLPRASEARRGGPAVVHNAWKPLAQPPAIFCLCALLAFSAACNHGPSQNRPSDTAAPKAQAGTKRYSLKGMVVSIDQQAGKATINNEPIAGFMDQMVMAYTIQPPAALDRLQPGDSITADVVVDPNKYWLENVKVVAHSPTPANPPKK